MNFRSAIVLKPLVVSPDQPVRDAIALMGEVRNMGLAQQGLGQRSASEALEEICSSCVVVVEDEQVVGILTERDLMALVGQTIDGLIMQQVMVPLVVTLDESELSCLDRITQLLQQHCICHLPILDGQNRLVGIVTHSSLVEGTITDISYGKQAETKRRENDARWQFALDGTGDGLWDWNIQTQTLFLSHKWKTLLGYAPHEVGNTVDEWNKRIHPEDKDRCYGELERHFRGETEVYQTEHRMRCKDGSYRWVLDRGKVIEWTDTGEPLRMVGTDSDISDRKQVEQERAQISQKLAQLNQKLEKKVIERAAALQASEQKFQNLLEGAKNVLCSLDENCLFTYLSPQFTVLFGWEVEEWLGKSPRDLVHPLDLLPEIIEGTQDFVAFRKYEFRHRHQEGHYIWVSISSSVIRDDQGEFVAGHAILADISDRKQAEADLSASRQRYYSLLQSIDGVVWEYDLHREQFTFVSQKIEALLGYPIQDWLTIPRFWWDHVYIEDFVRVSKYCATALQHGRTFEMEYRMVAADGRLVWIYDISNLNLDGDDVPIKYNGLLLDISDRKATEIALDNAQIQFRRVAENIPGMIFQYVREANGSDRLTYISPKSQDLYDVEPEAAMENSELIWSKICPSDAEILRADLAKSAATLQPLGTEFRIVLSQDVVKWASVSASVERHENGTILWNGVVFDISQRKLTELALQHTNEELLRATQLKDEFLATMSHELRTPLNAILGMAEGLQDQIFGAITPQQLKSLKTIERSGSHLLELINDILDVTKIEAGQLELRLASVSVVRLCQSSLDFVEQQALNKQIQLLLKIPDPRNLWVDECRIRQVLINLLNNAIKFTPERGCITVEVHPPQDTESLLRITVTDTGIGIAPGDISKLFQPFIQIDSALNRQYTGTGLGLALVKRIVERHGGQVGLTSEVGVGSCFTIDLPWGVSPSAAMESPGTILDLNAPDLSQSRDFLILLAEDNEENINVFSDYLEVMGYRLIVARNGQEAINLVESHRPDLILMDVQMPGMDGIEAIKYIRQVINRKDIPIIALTALAMPEDLDRCMSAGADDYLSKPVKLKQLVATIQQKLAP